MNVAAQELDPATGPDLLSQVEVIIEREGGLVEAYVPIDLVDHEDVPVDAEHVAELAESIQKESDRHDNLGQLTPVLLAEVEGRDRFAIIDGFHRVPALKSLGKSSVYARTYILDKPIR